MSGRGSIDPASETESGGDAREAALDVREKKQRASITDPAEAAGQAVRLARSGSTQTICVHGDSPGAVAILEACREALS